MMRLLLIVVVAALAAGASRVAQDMEAKHGSIFDPSTYPAMFEAFKIDYKRVYPSGDEESRRYRAFAHNMLELAKIQKQNPLATFGVNDFADITEEELERKFKPSEEVLKDAHVNDPIPPHAVSTKSEILAASNKSINWVHHGVVTSVKNQGRCDVCWAFSAIGSVEAQWAMMGNPLVSLSEQEIVACPYGCYAGYTSTAYDFLIQQQGGNVLSYDDYPYTAGGGNKGECKLPSKHKPAAFIESWHGIPHDESQMKTWLLKNGPISFCLNARYWVGYKGGIITTCPPDPTNHCALLVGINSTAPTPYWIAKNQWGTGWGMDGYVWMKYGENACNLASGPTTAVAPHENSNFTFAPTMGPTEFSLREFKDSASCTADRKELLRFKTMVCHPDSPSAGHSYYATCNATTLIFQRYADSDCSGNYTLEENPLNTCLKASNGNYNWWSCHYKA